MESDYIKVLIAHQEVNNMLVLLVLAVLFPSPFQARQAVGAPLDYQDPEAYVVYSMILPSDWVIRDAHAKHLVILRETHVYQMCLRPEPEFEQTLGQAIKDYSRINSSAWLSQDKFDSAFSYELISNEKLTATLGKGNWENFHAYFPESKGFLEFSAVGFNEDKTIAVVYMGHSCGLLCGGGGFHVLEKKEGKWLPLHWKGSSCAWVS